MKKTIILLTMLLPVAIFSQTEQENYKNVHEKFVSLYNESKLRRYLQFI